MTDGVYDALRQPDSMKEAAQWRALALAARHVNASLREPIAEGALLDALRTGAPPDRYEHHLFAFFDETDLATLTDLVLAGGVTYGQLAGQADRVLRAGHPTRRWLDERRGC